MAATATCPSVNMYPGTCLQYTHRCPQSSVRPKTRVYAQVGSETPHDHTHARIHTNGKGTLGHTNTMCLHDYTRYLCSHTPPPRFWLLPCSMLEYCQWLGHRGGQRQSPGTKLILVYSAVSSPG